MKTINYRRRKLKVETKYKRGKITKLDLFFKKNKLKFSKIDRNIKKNKLKKSHKRSGEE